MIQAYHILLRFLSFSGPAVHLWTVFSDVSQSDTDIMPSSSVIFVQVIFGMASLLFIMCKQLEGHNV